MVLSTRSVLTVKVRLVEPAGMVTLEGTVATLVLLLDSVTTAPPTGAGALSVTVPIESSLPCTLVGLSVSDDSTTPAPGVKVGAAVPVGADVQFMHSVLEYSGFAPGAIWA